jgi:cell division protein FtsB
MKRALRQIESQKLYEKLVGPLLIAVGIFYLTFHALSGERGIYALLKEERKLAVLQTELTAINAQSSALEHHTRLLSSGSLDLDLLDEQSRSLLGVTGKDEMVIQLAK